MTVAIEAPRGFIAVDGDSFVRLPLTPNTYGELMRDALEIPTYSNGSDGKAATDLVFSTRQRFRGYVGSGLQTLYTVLDGTNDLIFTADTAATIYAAKVAQCAIAANLGYTFTSMGTVLPYSSITGPREIVRLALNVLILAGEGTDFDLAYDFAALPGMNNPVGPKFADGIHLSVEGMEDWVAYAAPLSETLMGL